MEDLRKLETKQLEIILRYLIKLIKLYFIIPVVDLQDSRG